MYVFIFLKPIWNWPTYDLTAYCQFSQIWMKAPGTLPVLFSVLCSQYLVQGLTYKLLKMYDLNEGIITYLTHRSRHIFDKEIRCQRFKMLRTFCCKSRVLFKLEWARTNYLKQIIQILNPSHLPPCLGYRRPRVSPGIFSFHKHSLTVLMKWSMNHTWQNPDLNIWHLCNINLMPTMQIMWYEGHLH